MRLTAHLPRPEDTRNLGKLLGETLFPGAVVGLSGELGTGKTTLVSGIADGLGMESGYAVSSPTFTVMQEYPCENVRLFHLDLYRISGPDDLDSTGYRDAVGGQNILVVEWPEREPGVLPEEHLTVELAYRDHGRDACLSARGDLYTSLLADLSSRIGKNPDRRVPDGAGEDRTGFPKNREP